MSDIFVSYKRGDMDKVALLVERLRNSGFDTWWDQDIPPSAPWEETTEQALENARVLVVCWSPAAIASEMVKAEARRAKSQGKLVQVFLEPCDPPLFFGERQGVDLSNWSGDSEARNFAILVDHLREILGKPTVPAPTEPGTEVQGAHQEHEDGPRKGGLLPRRFLFAIAGSLALLAGLAAAWALWPETHSIPTIAVVGNGEGQSAEIAAGVTADLNRLASAQSGSFHLSSDGAADYHIKVSLRAGQAASADLSLLANDSSEILWSGTVALPDGAEQSLRPTIAAKLGNLLTCTFTGLGLPSLSRADGRLWLGACDALSQPGSQRSVTALAELVRRNPDFAPGWSALAVAEAENLIYSPAPRSRTAGQEMERSVRSHVGRAHSLGETSGNTIIAEYYLLADHQWLERLALLDEGITAAPENAKLRLLRGLTLAKLGRLAEGLESVRRAVELNPLSPDIGSSFATALLDAGAEERGWKEIERAEQLWPGSDTVKEARFYAEFRHGNGRRALELFESGQTNFGGATPWGPRPTLVALADPTPANVTAAIKWVSEDTLQNVASAPVRVQNLVALGAPEKVSRILEPDGAIDFLRSSSEVLFPSQMRPLREDPSFMGIAERAGLAAAWEKSGVWPDFCDDVRLPYDCREELRKVRAIAAR